MAGLNALWARAIVQELTRGGVRHAVVCPGSRSTPLALACADEPSVKTWSVVDERTAGFFALGLALESGTPAAVVVTSGTAGAHLYPAVMEAFASHAPLVVVTADRPWELHGFGAPQTALQERLYGELTRGYFGLQTPEASSEALVHLRAVVARAVARSQSLPRGPVHLNAPFREPLAPVSDEPTPGGLSQEAVDGRGSAPFLSLRSAFARAPLAGELADVVQKIRATERGVIVCGPRSAGGLSAAVLALSRATGYPVLAEAASQVRWAAEAQGVVSQYDVLLRSERFAKGHRPELELRFGGGLTSKRLTEWLDGSGAEVALFSEDGEPVDPSHRAFAAVVGDAAAAAHALAASGMRATGGPWIRSFQAAQARVAVALETAFGEQQLLTEPRIAFETARALPEGGRLFVASSMPVRDVDAFGLPRTTPIRVHANRGVNGIDGTLSSALGVAVASERPTVLLTGDLAFLHDLNGLLIARRHGLRLTIVVVNNDGGGIFSFLPVAQIPQHFEELFATPHGLTLSHAAALFGATYSSPETPAELRAALHEHVGRGLSVLEVRVDRHGNPAEHRRLYARAQAALEEGPWP